MVDQYVEVTDAPGCFQKIKDSIARVGVGILMILISFPLLFWNEGRAVKRAQDLEFGRGSVVSVKADKADGKNAGKLLHMSGKLAAKKPAVDPKFKLSTDAIGLKRNVEMYQWKEKKDSEKKGDKTVTTYSYVEEWSSSAINSSNFKKTGYSNPSMPAESETFWSPSINLGGYAVSSNLADSWPVDEAYAVKSADLSKFGKLNGRTPTIDGSAVYFGDPANTKIGDVRISYSIGKPGTATVVSGFKDGKLVPFTHKEMNGSIGMLTQGKKSADDMFTGAEESNEMMTWILRVVGFLLMFAGFNLVFGPIDTIVRMIPLIGAVIDFGTTVIAFVLAGAFSFITIAIGWIFYRPLIGILLLGIAGLFIGGGIFLAMKAKKKAE